MLNTVSSSAMAMSQTALSPAPPPMAAPCMRPISGTGSSSSARNIAEAALASRMFSVSEAAVRHPRRVRSGTEDFPSPTA